MLIPPAAPHSSSIIRDWYERPASGRRTKWTRSHPTPISCAGTYRQRHRYILISFTTKLLLFYHLKNSFVMNTKIQIVTSQRWELSGSSTEELLEWKSSASGSRKLRLLTAVEMRCSDHATSSIRKTDTNFADMRPSLGRYSSLAD
jgi:hypothetical protein